MVEKDHRKMISKFLYNFLPDKSFFFAEPQVIYEAKTGVRWVRARWIWGSTTIAREVPITGTPTGRHGVEVAMSWTLLPEKKDIQISGLWILEVTTLNSSFFPTFWCCTHDLIVFLLAVSIARRTKEPISPGRNALKISSANQHFFFSVENLPSKRIPVFSLAISFKKNFWSDRLRFFTIFCVHSTSEKNYWKRTKRYRPSMTFL